MTLRAQITAAAILCSCLQTHGQTAASFGDATAKAFDRCSFQMSAALVFGDERHYAQTKECVDGEVANAERDFRPALAAARTDSQRSLEAYHAAWLAGIRSLASLQYGSRSNAERSAGDTKRRLSELWALFEIDTQR